MSNHSMNRKNSKKESVQKHLPKGRSSNLGGSQNPPQFVSNIRNSHKFRFVASAAYNSQVSDTAILGVPGAVCTVVNTTAAMMTQCFRIKKIEVWAAPAAQGSSATVSLDWIGLANSPNLEVSDTTLSVARNAHIIAVPPINSLAHFWNRGSNTAMFTLVCPINSIIDVTLEYILDDVGTLTTVGVVTGVLNTLYYLPLDGVTTHLLTPVSLQSTF